MLNRRHKAILFFTLVLTGSGLLAGMTSQAALGMLLLGVAFAWLVGSEAVFRTYDYLRTAPNKTWPWLRVVLLMGLAGCLLVAVAVWSNFNSFFVVSAMSAWGMLMAPFHRLPTERRWLKFVVWGLGILIFFLATVGASMLIGTSVQNTRRIGELGTYGLIALPIGMLWLMKGWRLILAGISQREGSTATQTENSRGTKGTKWLYVSLFVGTLALTLSLALLAFSASSDSVFSSQVKATSKPSAPVNLMSPVIVLMLLAWWPYAAWKNILEREPNTTLANAKTHKRVTAVLGMLFATILCVATTFGIQNGSDRMTTFQLEQGPKGFQDLAVKIGTIKSRNLRTTKDYIDAYEEIEPLQVDFDQALRHFTDILREVKERDKNRGPFNIQRLYGGKEKEWLAWDERIFELLRQDSELTRRQVLVIQQMAALPEDYQIEFWKKNFQPLIEEEDALRHKITSLKAAHP